MSEISSIQSSLSSYLLQQQDSTSSSSTAQSTRSQLALQQGMKRLEEDLQSGKTTAEEVQAKFQKQFGNTVDDAFLDDGTVDIEKLGDILKSKIQTSDNSTDSTSTSSSSTLSSAAILKNLTSMFGDSAKEVVGEDGKLDYDKLNTFLNDMLTSLSSNSQTSTNTLNSLLSTGLLLNIQA